VQLKVDLDAAREVLDQKIEFLKTLSLQNSEHQNCL
jgi:hypothetical protein